ncbi:hypothetical protein BH09VER1_BH09VER1_16980 [soil metagenome]
MRFALSIILICVAILERSQGDTLTIYFTKQGGEGATYRNWPGHLYVRYSVDAKNWTTWQSNVLLRCFKWVGGRTD